MHSILPVERGETFPEFRRSCAPRSDVPSLPDYSAALSMDRPAPWMSSPAPRMVWQPVNTTLPRPSSNHDHTTSFRSIPMFVSQISFGPRFGSARTRNTRRVLMVTHTKPPKCESVGFCSIPGSRTRKCPGRQVNIRMTDRWDLRRGLPSSGCSFGDGSGSYGSEGTWLVGGILSFLGGYIAAFA